MKQGLWLKVPVGYRMRFLAALLNMLNLLPCRSYIVEVVGSSNLELQLAAQFAIDHIPVKRAI